MAQAILKAIWKGPFYIGPLSQPVSIGDVLLKLLETIWRLVISMIALAIVAGLGIYAWVEIVEPALFPPLKSQISVTAEYDDGTAPEKLPPISQTPSNAPAAKIEKLVREFRCTPDHPIKVTMRNNASKQVRSVSFSIEGYLEGYSENYVTDASWRTSTAIMPPSAGWMGCYAASVSGGVDPSLLKYKINVWAAE